MESTAPFRMPPKPPSTGRTSITDFIGSTLTTLAEVEAWLTGSVQNDAISRTSKVSQPSTKLTAFPAPPPKSKRQEINMIVTDTITRSGGERILTFDTFVRTTGNLAKIYFTPAEFSWGKLQPSNIKENYLYVNGVYIKKKYYTVYEEDTSLVVELIDDLGYRLELSYDIKLRIRAST